MRVPVSFGRGGFRQCLIPASRFDLRISSLAAAPRLWGFPPGVVYGFLGLGLISSKQLCYIMIITIIVISIIIIYINICIYIYTHI